MMGEPDATREQVVTFLVKQYGRDFVRACGMDEVNTDVKENDQVLDAILHEDQLAASWVQWRNQVRDSLAGVTAKPGIWQQQIEAEVSERSPRFADQIRVDLNEASRKWAHDLPEVVVEQTSRVLARWGLPVAIGLLEFLCEQCEQASTQLENETRTLTTTASGWSSLLGQVINQYGQPNAAVGSDNDLIADAIKKAGSGAYRQAQATVRTRAGELLDEAVAQVLAPLIETLRQMSGSIGNERSRKEVEGWPVDGAVPMQFAPSPFEYCLIDASGWPSHYVDHLATTAHAEGLTLEEVRGVVGGGGFIYEVDAVQRAARLALRIQRGARWDPRSIGGSGIPVSFEGQFSVPEILERCRDWIHRPDTNFGRFLDQGLSGYLSKEQGGTLVQDHGQRVDFFEELLARTLASAKPLIDENPQTTNAVHPNVVLDTVLVPERLPLSADHPARAAAERVLHDHINAPGGAELDYDSFFSDGTRDRSAVTYVSRLKGAIHPSAVGSLVSPIANSWNAVKDNEARRRSFWNDRRARTLDEFIPVEGEVLRSMIRGWFTARILGLIPDPDTTTGFKIFRAPPLEPARFPWPLLDGMSVEGSMSYLPRLLESLVLGFALFPSDRGSLTGYDELYLLGQADRAHRQRSYGSPAAEIRHWIVNGANLTQNANALIEGEDAEGRQLAFARLVGTQVELYQQRRNQNPVRSDEHFLKNDFYDLPIGIELVPMIDEELKRIHEVVKGWKPPPSPLDDKSDGTERSLAL